jgi:hypothetical protein
VKIFPTGQEYKKKGLDKVKPEFVTQNSHQPATSMDGKKYEYSKRDRNIKIYDYMYFELSLSIFSIILSHHDLVLEWLILPITEHQQKRIEEQ